MHGYDPNLLSRYIGLSKKPHQALSILVIPIHEKMASGPWTIDDGTEVDHNDWNHPAHQPIDPLNAPFAFAENKFLKT